MRFLGIGTRQGRSHRRFVVVLALLAASSARAQDTASHPVDSALEMMNLKTEAGAMPGFVEQSRGSAGAQDYLPVGVRPQPRTLKAKSAAEVKALTADLDAARDAQLAGRRPRPMGAGGSPAAPPKPKIKSGVAATNR